MRQPCITQCLAQWNKVNFQICIKHVPFVSDLYKCTCTSRVRSVCITWTSSSTSLYLWIGIAHTLTAITLHVTQSGGLSVGHRPTGWPLVTEWAWPSSQGEVWCCWLYHLVFPALSPVSPQLPVSQALLKTEIGLYYLYHTTTSTSFCNEVYCIVYYNTRILTPNYMYM